MVTLERNDRGQLSKLGQPSVARACPHCKGSVYRVPRRFVDVLLSTVFPVHRYRCGSMGCEWEGNLRAKRPRLSDRGQSGS